MASAPTGLKKPVFIKIGDLKPTSSGVNLIAKVVSCNIVVERTRPDGSRIRIAECLVADDTGCLVLGARNAQIDAIDMSAGTPTIEIRNGKIEMFQGFMRLMVDKWGLVRAAAEAASFEPNTTNNPSNVEYELVNVQDDSGRRQAD
eukprot:EC125017.1.p2 GENE.EC125017.1~~EC125017.1.p2  ORF type:complete len:146 (+),score=19.07 EC125017.1:123-560(+)